MKLLAAREILMAVEEIDSMKKRNGQGRPAARALLLVAVVATLSLVTLSANAQISCGIASPAVRITSYNAPYNSVWNAQGLSIYESKFLRAQGMTDLAAKYRSTHPGALPN